MESFRTEIQRRLDEMRKDNPSGRSSSVAWPAGCDGSVRSWLIFVGPSPGGSCGTPACPPDPMGGSPLWNEDYEEPFRDRPAKRRTVLRILPKTIMGLRLEEGAQRFFAFANFDLVPTGDVRKVSLERMRAGVSDVLRVLGDTKPKVIVTMGRVAHGLLGEAHLDQEGYGVRRPASQEVQIQIGARGSRCHRRIDAFKLTGSGFLAGAIIVRCPQHPARLSHPEYAGRCARAIRACVEQLEQGETVPRFREVGNPAGK